MPKGPGAPEINERFSSITGVGPNTHAHLIWSKQRGLAASTPR